MLNPDWEKYLYNKDLALWKKMIDGWEGYYKFRAEEFFDDYEDEIVYLYNTYYRTNEGWRPNPDKAIRQKFFVLKKDDVFNNLRHAIDNKSEKDNREWNENQLRDESLDARLEREKGEYESKESSLRLSKRD